METADRQHALREGMTAYGAEGEQVGKVVAVDPNYVVVEKGFFFPSDYYIPASAIARADEDDLYLVFTKDEALRQGWDRPPTASAVGYAPDAGYDLEAVGIEDREPVRVPIHEEELLATKRPVEAGVVRIEKDVVEEERVVDVPVIEERVRVRRVAAEPGATPEPGAFEEGTIEVPIRGEEVELQTQTRVAGAVEVAKAPVERIERVVGTVRREQVRVDDQIVEPVTEAGEAPPETERGF